MKRLVTLMLFVLTIVLSASGFQRVYAYNPLENTCSNAAQGTDFCNNVSADEKRTIVYGYNNIFVRIVQTVVIITGAISVIMILIGGLRYILSAGDPGATKGAKDTILYAVIGLVVVVFGQVIIAFVLSRFK